MTQKKKLIEVALPLEAINKASGREKFIRHGHPSTPRTMSAPTVLVYQSYRCGPREWD
jgi:Protein of unknown function (DUF1156)